MSTHGWCVRCGAPIIPARWIALRCPGCPTQYTAFVPDAAVKTKRN